MVALLISFFRDRIRDLEAKMDFYSLGLIASFSIDYFSLYY